MDRLTEIATRYNLSAAAKPVGTASFTEPALLWCTGAFPARAEAGRLRGIPDVRAWSISVAGFSDHTLGTAVAVASVTLGASIIEKHVTLDHDLATADGAFFLDPAGLVAQLVRDTRTAWSASGVVAYGPADAERQSLRYRRGIYFVSDLAAGSQIGTDDLRPLRPVAAVGPDAISEVIG